MYFKDLLRYRQVWLGVALIWIIMYHTPFDFGIFSYLKSIGYGGVDICLFASGIGCYYSLSNDSNVLNFMKRRLKRLFPTYIVFIFVWLAYKYAVGQFGYQMVIGNLLALQNLTGHGQAFNWYISAIFLLYILAPYFKEFVQRATPLQRIVFLVFLFVCSIPFWRATTYIITISRLPIFYLGMVFADVCKKEAKISRKHIIGMTVLFILGMLSLVTFTSVFAQYLWPYGLYWYPFILITPPLCVAISYIAIMLERIKVTKPIIAFFSLCGDYSFELYLVHILLTSCIPIFIDTFQLSHITYFIWGAGVVLLFIGCFILRRVSKFINGLFLKHKLKTE